MKKTFMLLGFLALWGAGSAQAEMITPEVPSAPVTGADMSPAAPESIYLPLRELIRRYSGKTGIQIKLSQKLRDDAEVLEKRYSSRDDTWLEEFSRVEYDNQQTGKKEIILLKSRYYDASTIPDPAPPRSGSPVQRANPQASFQQGSQKNPDADETDLGLSREKLFKLMRFPFKGPFSDEWFQDEDYRQFLARLQIDSPSAFEDRRVVMKIRNEARKQFRRLRTRR